MAKLPNPPASLAIPPALTVIARGSRFWRIHFAGGAHPTTWNAFRFFGPTTARFDHHDEPARVQDRGILYVARSPVTCLAEVFQAARVIDRGARQPWLASFAL